ncbi:MAG: hypothetical protein KME43_18115 [Myxacorys chilensis ATA2-1-KO14]|nr:hypothetical protein [Myxacorys chilensis ATA2-1-KO14]
MIELGFRELGLIEIRGISVSANSRVARLAQRYGLSSLAHLLAQTGCDREDETKLNGSYPEVVGGAASCR